MTTAILYHPQLLQLARRIRHPLPPDPQHVGDQLLGHELVTREPVEGEQQPAAELLIDGVVTIAHRRLRHLGQERLGVAQHQVQHVAVQIEFAFEQLPFQAVGMASTLHQGAAGGAFAPHEQGHPDQPLVAHHGDLRRGAVFHHIEQGDDAVDGEIDMAQGVARFVQDLAQG
ncbi:hypothetical protein D3C71_1529410 [compost metagenome]